MKYKCPHCKKVVERKSKKMWIESYCDIAQRIVRLQRVKIKGGKDEETKSN